MLNNLFKMYKQIGIKNPHSAVKTALSAENNQSQKLCMASRVLAISSSSSQPSISAPLVITSLEQPAANFLSLNFFLTDFGSISYTLFDGRISTAAPIRPVNSSVA